ncbi:hypothetical protein SH2C18_51400 [Clostridium sediminicola]|uniref:sigma factor n=1 Tax=Clostridium sediminicola TaxID=3114879 RepID=UPI0031F237B9
MKNLEQLYEEISIDIFKYIMNLSGNKAIAEDIVQETFYKALEHMTTNEKKN